MRIVATAGHVDHGKSSLVQALTGTNPDRWEEERRRGLTIDLGFAHTTLPGGHDISFIDVPGHVRFLRNMLAGVGAVDACLFVVAATEGWKPQSEEHLRILSLLGVRHGVVVLTMRDLVDDDTCELRELEVRDRLDGSFLADAPVVAVSCLTGDGLDVLRAELAALAERTPASVDGGRPRLWIDRVFAARGSGTVVTGTLTGGSVAVDDHLHAGAHAVRVRGIQSHGHAAAHIGPGHRVALNLVGVDHHQLERGDAVVRIDQWRPTLRFDATLQVLSSLDHDVTRRGSWTVHVGSGEFPAKVRVLGTERLAPGEHGLVRVHLSTSLPLVRGDRFVLRESGRDETVGGGEVLDVAPVLPASKARPDHSIERLVAEHGSIDVDDLEAFTGERRDPTLGRFVLSPAASSALFTRVEQRVTAAGELGVDVATLDELERAAIATIDTIEVANGRARVAAVPDPFADHPAIETMRKGGCAPPDPSGIDRATVRELVRRSLLIERDGLLFHPDAIELASHTAARLLDSTPEGFTVSQFREALGVTRKHAVPLAAELDARGITRRRDDVRIAGPRLPRP